MTNPVNVAAVIGLLLLAACEGRQAEVVTSPVIPETPAALAGSAAQLFAAAQQPTAGAPQVFGSYARGCLAGAEQLSLDAPRWQVMRPSRNRAWGHPALIRVVRAIADGVAADGHRGLLVGDLGQPRGGPSPSDHNSHQIGLDVDIWLTPLPERRLDAAGLETYEPPSMVAFGPLRVSGNFGAAQVSMLMHAATHPDVERIFVSPPIKRALCRRTTGDRGWLRKIRPWPGHMSHMHVRLACPPGSDGCKAQQEPPVGDGCGEELQSWFDDTSWMRPSTERYVPEAPMDLDALPATCRRVLTQSG